MGLRLAPVPLLAVSLAACSGNKAKQIEDARSSSSPGTAKPADAAAPAPPPLATVHGYRVDPAAKTGDVQIRVEWKDVPQALRAPGPPTTCGRPRSPALAPSTLWGIPDVLVSVDVDHGKAFEPPRARLALEDCQFSPRVIVAGPTLHIASAMASPTAVALQEVARPLGGAALTTKPRTIYLPIIGHEVEAALEPDTVYTVAAGTDDLAAVVSATTPYVGVTESSGNLVLRDIPIGTHPVRAYLPPRNGIDARVISATVTVTAGALAEITLDLSRP